jgi:uncharacterized membrane protein (DUF106 family)
MTILVAVIAVVMGVGLHFHNDYVFDQKELQDIAQAAIKVTTGS